ncbi:Flp1 family type IVb pilin [Fusibacter bizertensis]|uniref:Flp1 family type IVb pilin n=1 Tax=Fusibacter bizertensis TaxID=1488331 RepID=A0ABT6N813_9FIRM|nr:Flp1 family type IVb pilin [Fusibacter bizertensis]MDH8676551.1 Flp1 family type IVb pilin [Fusibacter bizertensis]
MFLNNLKSIITKKTIRVKHCLNFNLNSESGMGTIEIVIIIAVLIGLAFLFRTFAVSFFNELTQGIKDNNQIDSLFNN